MRSITRLLPLVALAALAACSEKSAVAPNADIALDRAGGGATVIHVMTRNMYLGADEDPVVQALISGDQSAIFGALGTALQQLQHTDYLTRVDAMADEVEKNRPDVVGLQEAYQLDVYVSALGFPGPDVHMDLGAALLSALAKEGLHYVVAAKNTSTDLLLAGGAIHLVDHDMLLVNAERVSFAGPPVATTFSVNLGNVGGGVTILRGYVARSATIDRLPVLLVNSHLEDFGALFPEVRQAQAAELATFIGSAPRVILTGDLNDVAGSLMYQVLAGSQLTDTWAALRPRDPGFSCCQAADLSNAQSILDQRIDYIWTRGLEGPSGGLQGNIRLVSALPSSRVQGAFGLIWPSDHAGLAADLVVPPPVLR